MNKVPVFLFNQENPKGQMFKFVGGKQSEEYQAMLEKGWVDTPAKLELPEEMNTGVKIEDAKNARPEDLIGIIQSYGFLVLTPEQLKAEAVKMADVALDIGNFSDEDLIAEAERRGLKESNQGNSGDVGSMTELEELRDKFNEDPESLTKAEHVELGNSLYSLGLRENMKEDTLIAKIKAAMNGETNNAD
jgi:hypothetical protein